MKWSEIPARFWKFPLTRIAVYVSMSFALAVFMQTAIRYCVPTLALGSKLQLHLVIEMTQAYAAFFVFWLMAVRWEKQSLAKVGFPAKGMLLDTSAGFTIGLLLVTLMVMGMVMFGIYHVYGRNSNVDLITALAMFFFVAFTEEVVFRGYILQTLERSLGTTFAFFLTAVFFGLAHMLNTIEGIDFGQQLFGCIALIFEAGILLNAAYLFKRSLWFPIGIHWAWNFFEGPIFGLAVSGTSNGAPIYQAQMTGTFLATGGKFGPEASLSGFLVGTTLGLLVLWMSVKRGQWRRMPTPKITVIPKDKPKPEVV